MNGKKIRCDREHAVGSRWETNAPATTSQRRTPRDGSIGIVASGEEDVMQIEIKRCLV